MSTETKEDPRETIKLSLKWEGDLNEDRTEWNLHQSDGLPLGLVTSFHVRRETDLITIFGLHEPAEKPVIIMLKPSSRSGELSYYKGTMRELIDHVQKAYPDAVIR